MPKKHVVLAPANVPELQKHEKSCATCRFYRTKTGAGAATFCLLTGRLLNTTGDPVADEACFCVLWKKRPRTWSTVAATRPFHKDKHISRRVLLRMRKEVLGTEEKT